MEENIFTRYQRQIILKGFGEAAQQKLSAAKVLVIGAGGLGSAALLYLAAAGVGTIGIVDFDTVALHNLHRQVIFTMADIGLPKAQAAAERLRALNSDISYTVFNERLLPQNCLQLFSAFDIIIDGTDNFASRYMINDACVLLKKPLVYGAVAQFEGQVAVLNATPKQVSYRDLFPNPPKPDEVLNCAEAGVLGILPGIIGTMQASETIKLITGIGESLKDQLFTLNVLSNQTLVVQLNVHPLAAAAIPASEAAFSETNYDWLCGTEKHPLEIDAHIFNKLLRDNNFRIIDVREQGELPQISSFLHEKVPLSLLAQHLPDLMGTDIVFVCQTGKRSLQAAISLADASAGAFKVYSLSGGLLNYRSPIAE
jgi:sulfur-carrier protein adenylyltransferase/sulfurtransferase